MSQNPRALKIVAADSGQPRLVLRPLSARLLPPTEAEEIGWVVRDRLLVLSGRSRRAQMALAEKFGLPIPTPAGGCLLTDPGFSRRFKWLLAQPQGRGDPAWPPARLAEIIKRGRLFSPAPGQWFTVGRNQAENLALAGLAEDGDILCRLEGAPGPEILAPRLAGQAPAPETLALARNLAAAYGDPGPGTEAPVQMETCGGRVVSARVRVTRPADWAVFLV
jgi:hypothetical protein